jgi:hypothetical protein
MPYSRNAAVGRASVDLNTLWGDLRRDEFTMEEMVKFYMQTGYSLSGFCEVFGQKEAYEFGLPGAKQPFKENHYLGHAEDEVIEDDSHYVENIIDYLCRVHEGKVLSL